VHTPVHASWLNQVEIYFSIVQRKAVTPNDFTSLRELEERLLAFQVRYEQTAKPFQWAFTGGSGRPVDQAQSQGDESRRLTGEYVTVIMKHSTKLAHARMADQAGVGMVGSEGNEHNRGPPSIRRREGRPPGGPARRAEPRPGRARWPIRAAGTLSCPP
jgi:hypothetical protein